MIKFLPKSEWNSIAVQVDHASGTFEITSKKRPNIEVDLVQHGSSLKYSFDIDFVCNDGSLSPSAQGVLDLGTSFSLKVGNAMVCNTKAIRVGINMMLDNVNVLASKGSEKNLPRVHMHYVDAEN